MRDRSKRTIVGAIGAMALCLLGVALAGGQPPQQAGGTEMAEDAFLNIQVLRGIPVDEFMRTMGVFVAATGLNCTGCHGAAGDETWETYADDGIPQKQTARQMYIMMTTINQSFFGGRRVVTCYTCHQGISQPRVTANLDVQYSEPIPEAPGDLTENAFGAPSVDEVLTKYIEALGGEERLAALTSFVATGAAVGYGPEGVDERPLELYAKAPNQQHRVIHTADGDNIATFDGSNGWTVVPHKPVPDPVLTLTTGDLDGAHLNALLSFPGQIREALSDWLVGFSYIIDDREVRFVQARVSPGGPPVKMFFDEETGLLVRVLRYGDSPVGRNPTRMDYSDYREIPGTGVMMPFQWTETWTDGQENIRIDEVRPNVPIEASRFDRPTPNMAAANIAR